MKAYIRITVLVAAMVFMVFGEAIAQPVYQVNVSKSKLTISGTSNLHDWTLDAEDFSCNALLDVSKEEVKDLKNINFSIPVENIKGESSIMDNKAHDALKESKSPVITFRQQALETLNSSNGQVSGRISGSLTIAGRTKPISLSFTGKVLDNNSLSVKGNLALKMSDYGITTPTALLGTLKTDDAVTLEYSFEFDQDLTSSR